MTKNAPAAPSFPRTSDGDEVRMLVQGPGRGKAVKAHTGEDGKRRVVAELGLISRADVVWVTTNLDGSAVQYHDTQYDALARFAS